MTFNTRNPAVKRLMREAKELAEPTELYYAQPLNDNLFEWHFTIRGPDGSDFAGGIYHGRISLPTEYPMKPPNITFFTPNGRFELYRQLCLSISGYHPETWRPSWSIRTALLAIIGFMPTSGAGAIGSLDQPPDKRRELAVSSLQYSCDICGQTKDLVLPLTKASAEIAKEASEVASQFNIIDQSLQKSNQDSEPVSELEDTQPSDVSATNMNVSRPPNVGLPTQNSFISESIQNSNATNPERNYTETSPCSIPQPMYWVCYPVFDQKTLNGIASGTFPSIFPQSVPTVTPPSPLSFEEWLKKRNASTANALNSDTDESLQKKKNDTVILPSSPHSSEVSVEKSRCFDLKMNSNASNSVEIEAATTNLSSLGVEPTVVTGTAVAAASIENENEVPPEVNPSVCLDPSTSIISQPDSESLKSAFDEIKIQTGTGTLITTGTCKMADSIAECKTPLSQPDGEMSVSSVRDSSPLTEIRRRIDVSVTKRTIIKKVDSPKEVAQKILREAAARHQRAIFASDLHSTTTNNEHVSVQRVRSAQLAALIVSLLLITLVCRRLSFIVL